MRRQRREYPEGKGSEEAGSGTNLGGVHREQMFLRRFVFARTAADALSHHQHEVLFAAAERHQALVGVGDQQFLSTRVETLDVISHTEP